MKTADTSVVDLRGAPPQIVPPPNQLDELTPGLVLFFARPSPLQTYAEFFGHEWRHVGVTVETDAGLMVASYCVRKCFRLDDPAEIMGNYNRVGVARICSNDAEVEAIEGFCRRFEHLERADSPYTFSGIVIGPIHLMARRRPPGLIRRLLMTFVYMYCWLQNIRYRDRTALSCSTFTWAALDHGLDRPLRLPLSAHPDDEAAYATPATERDRLFARWLCGPTELWNAISPECRTELDLTNLDGKLRSEKRAGFDQAEEPTTIIDLREPAAQPRSASVKSNAGVAV